MFSVHNASRVELQDKQEPLGSEVDQEEASKRKRPTVYLLTQQVLLYVQKLVGALSVPFTVNLSCSELASQKVL